MSQEKLLCGKYILCEEILDTIKPNLVIFTSMLIVILCEHIKCVGKTFKWSRVKKSNLNSFDLIHKTWNYVYHVNIKHPV